MHRQTHRPLRNHEQAPEVPSKSFNGYRFSEVSPIVIRKLIFQIIRENVTYPALLDSIASSLASPDPSTVIGLLEDLPYQLQRNEAEQFMAEFKSMAVFLGRDRKEGEAKKDLTEEEQRRAGREAIRSILAGNIPPFKSITIRKDFALTNQICNVEAFIIAEAEELRVGAGRIEGEVQKLAAFRRMRGSAGEGVGPDELIDSFRANEVL